MAVYFFGSSALFKRYVMEIGTGWVLGITDPAAGHNIYLASITGAEVISALVRQFPPLAPVDLVRIIAEFKFDFHNQYQRLTINDSLITAAMILAENYKLRGYDAVQLAAGMGLNTVAKSAGLQRMTFVSSDNQLNCAASTEGLVVEDPSTHP